MPVERPELYGDGYAFESDRGRALYAFPLVSEQTETAQATAPTKTVGRRDRRRRLRRRPARAHVRDRRCRKVLLVDVAQRVVDALNRGHSHIEDVADDELEPARRRGAARRDVDYDELRSAAAILIALPTPLSRQREPDLSIVLAATSEIAKRLQPGHLVVLESTTYPGTTREQLLPILESSGLKAGRTSTSRSRLSASIPAPRGTSATCRRWSAASRRSADAAQLSSTLGDQDGASRLVAGGRGADEAPREHLPLGQHRARQRARTALRPDGHRRLGGRRRRCHEAVRVHELPARARAWAVTASRSIPSTSRGKRASTASRPSSSSSPARSTRQCRTTAVRSSRRR